MAYLMAHSKESACIVGDTVSTPWARRSWRRKCQPTPGSCLGNPIHRGSLVGWVLGPGNARRDTTDSTITTIQVFILLHETYLTQHNALRVHPFCCKWPLDFLPLLLNNILLCIYHTLGAELGEVLFKGTNLQLVDKEVLGLYCTA